LFTSTTAGVEAQLNDDEEAEKDIRPKAEKNAVSSEQGKNKEETLQGGGIFSFFLGPKTEKTEAAKEVEEERTANAQGKGAVIDDGGAEDRFKVAEETLHKADEDALSKAQENASSSEQGKEDKKEKKESAIFSFFLGPKTEATEAEKAAEGEGGAKTEETVGAGGGLETGLEVDEETFRKAEEDARFKVEEADERFKAEEEARQKAEEEVHLKAEEENRQKVQEVARRIGEDEAQLSTEQEVARLKTGEEAREKAETEAQIKTGSEEAQLKIEEESHLQAEADGRPKTQVEEKKQTKEREGGTREVVSETARAASSWPSRIKLSRAERESEAQSRFVEYAKDRHVDRSS
jgi:hypothetical protein